MECMLCGAYLKQTGYKGWYRCCTCADISKEALEEIYNLNQPERLSPEACDCSGINVMYDLDKNSKKCIKCGSIFTRYDSPN